VLVPTGTALAATGTAGDRRGRLVSSTNLDTLATRSDVDGRLVADKFDAGTDRYGVRTYRLVYRTVDPLGRPTTASGLLALPINNRTSLRTVSFAHGTEVFKGDAPSTSTDGFLTDPAVTFASAGFAAVAPDYLGLGLGPGLHPWMDVRSETTASLDLLRAARSFVAGTGTGGRDNNRHGSVSTRYPIEPAIHARGYPHYPMLLGIVVLARRLPP
jgi:hypothetical protein